MRRLIGVVVAIAMIGLCVVVSGAVAGEQRIVLKEHVNRQWTNELLSYPFAAPRGECHVDSVRLEGPRGFVPVQLSDVELWPGTQTVRAAKLWLVADLAPLAEDVYTVRYGPRPVRAGLRRGDLRVVADAEQAEMTTSRFGARMRLGGERSAEQVSYLRESFEGWRVPGPVIALRLGAGTWFGGSRLFGDTAITEWQGRLTATGPVFAEAEYKYHYEDGTVVTARARLHEGSPALYWETNVPGSLPDDGIDIVLSAGLPTLSLTGLPAPPGESVPLDTYQRELVAHVNPWGDWWDPWAQTTVRLAVGETGRELHLSTQDPGSWVEPLAPGTMRRWGAWLHKHMPVKRGTRGEAAWRVTDATGAGRFTAPEGEIYLRVNHATGQRKFSVEDREPAFGEQRRMSLAQVKSEWPHLDEIKDWVLEWPGQEREHPHLFLSRQDLQRAWAHMGEPDPSVVAGYLAGLREEIREVPSYKDVQAVELYLMTQGKDAEVLEQIRLPERIRRHLASLGDFDKMRSTETVAGLYDLMMSTDMLSEEDRRLYRSQMAFLGYIAARPSTWSIERGYRSYNPNMSLAYLFATGIVACAIPDHPMAQAWVQPGLERAKIWLAEVGPEGEWYESAHYSQVSILTTVAFAVAAQQAGFEDLFLNEGLKKWAMWLAQIYTPRDPMEGRQNRRASPPIGRATAGIPWGVFGLMARATAETDPEYSRQMQWAWAGTNYNTNAAGHLGGFEPVYMDRTLPMEVPDWPSRLFPHMGPVLRNGVGDEHENQLIVHANTSAGARLPEVGALMSWFARGVPIAGAMPLSYPDRHPFMISRVNPALAWQEGEPWNELRYGAETDVRMGEFSALPRQDYFTASYLLRRWSDTPSGPPANMVSTPPVDREGTFPMTWHRRMLYLQDDEPGGLNYLVLRDGVRGGPSQWQMWTLSQKLGTPQQAASLGAFLGDAPGSMSVAASRLEQSDRFTAVGQFNVDVEYYIASPTDTERWTMRMGHRYVDYGVPGEDYRDLLHLRLPGDGEYFVVVFPRFREEAAPEFATLGEGTVIKVSGQFGTDYCFLAGEERQVTAEGAYFRGKAGSVQDRQGSVVLALGAPGEVRWGEWGLRAGHAASLRVQGSRLTVNLSYDREEGGEISLRVPGRWRVTQPARGVNLNAIEGGYRLAVPRGVQEVVLEQG